MRDRDWQDYRAGNVALPVFWIVGDGACTDAERAAEAVGVRVADRLTCAEMLAVFDAAAVERLILLELSNVLSADEDALIDRIAQGKGVTIASFPLAVLDVVVSRLSGPFATMLCDPDLTDRIAALSLMCVPVDSRVAEAKEGADSHRLNRLSSEVARIAQLLTGLVEEAVPGRVASVSDGLTGYRAPPAATGTTTGTGVVTARDIRTTIRLRGQRDAVFGAGLFADPVWEMLLDLAASRLEGTQVAVSSLCIAAAVPPTTALRWIAALTAAGTIVRVPDADDRRRVFLELSDAAAATLLDFLGEAKGAGLGFV